MLNTECRMQNGMRACAPSPFIIHHSSFCTSSRAFTLLEMVMVMLILSMLLALVAPSLSGFGAGRDAEYAGAQLMTLSRWAREQAISEGRVYRLNFDPAQQTYWVTAQVGGVFETINSDFGRPFTLPEGVVMEWDAAQEAGAYAVDFFPTGRARPVKIRVTSRDGQTSFIGNRTATEMLRALTAEEVAAG